jgi:hypothetical protein
VLQWRNLLRLLTRRPHSLVCLLLLAPPAPAGAQVPVYQQPSAFSFEMDAFYRREWTRNLFAGDDQERWRLQARPRLSFTSRALTLGVGGDFNYADDDNTEPPEGQTSIALQRDNFSSRDARLDLAFARIEPGSWLRLEGGRFALPVTLTEMIWDADVRPQGAAARLATDIGASSRVTATGLFSRGGHVFDDDGVTTLLGSATYEGGSFDLTASVVSFRDIDELDPSLIRQNSRGADGGFRYDSYDVIDVVLRIFYEGSLSVQLLADYAWNTAADDENRGFWGRARLGSMELARGMAEYTYADVDRDVTLAAYASDDFIWSTAWQGHRGELAFKTSERTALHFSAQWQRFKGSPQIEERDHWVQRYRLDLRLSY